MSSDPSHPQALEGESSAALLAELDSLLERMLRLPVNHLADPPAMPNVELHRDVPVITVTEAMPEAIIPYSPLPAVSADDDDPYRQALLHPPEEPVPEPTRLLDPVAIRCEDEPSIQPLP